MGENRLRHWAAAAAAAPGWRHARRGGADGGKGRSAGRGPPRPCSPCQSRGSSRPGQRPAARGESGRPLSLWLAGYVISLLDQTPHAGAQAAAHDPPAPGSAGSSTASRTPHPPGEPPVHRLVLHRRRPRRYRLPQAFCGCADPRGGRGDADRSAPARRRAAAKAFRAAAGPAAGGGRRWSRAGPCQLSEERLRVFTLAPTGLTMHFGPTRWGPTPKAALPWRSRPTASTVSCAAILSALGRR